MKISLSKAHTLDFAKAMTSFLRNMESVNPFNIFQGYELQGKLFLISRRRAKEKINSILPSKLFVCFSSFKQQGKLSRILRSNSCIQVEIPLISNNFQDHAATLFNKLPTNLKNTVDHDAFCREVKRFL